MENNELMKQCSRFDSCSATKCPLDFYINSREELPEDDKCKMEKRVRMRIGKDTNLKYQGMTKREWQGKQTWEAKPEAEKQAMIERGKIALSKVRRRA